MSYDRSYHGGHRRRPRDDYDIHDRRREVFETPEQKLRTAIIKLGEVDPNEELPRLAKQIRQHVPVAISVVSEGFLVGVTEQPFKIPFYAALLRLLHDPEDDTVPPETLSLGKQVLEDFWKGFQAIVDKLAWREARLCIHFFAHLTMAKVISADSMFSLLQSFVSVLDEFGVSHSRAKRAALCAAEGLMIGGPVLKPSPAANVTSLIDAIQSYNDMAGNTKWLVQPLVKLHSDSAPLENCDELLNTILASLKILNASHFAETFTTFPQPYADYPELDMSTCVPFNLPAVLVPPEIIELDGISAESNEEPKARHGEWPIYHVRLFDNDVTPDPNTPVGYSIRSTLLDLVDIFEVNRKECARLLLEYPKWALPGTFKPKDEAPVDVKPVPGKDWQLESTIIEVVLGSLMVLPESSHKSVYFITLITELCKLAPTTVGPAVGKAIRRLYASLGDGLDVEISRRFAEWFATHMSNFGFHWVWKEWIPDLSLTLQHPKRAYMRRAIEFEIRLAYHDRILKSLPEPMQNPEAQTISDLAPGPDYEYDDTASPYHDAAQSVLNLLRGRAKANDVISHLDSLKNSLEPSEGDVHVNVDTVVRSIAIQSLLHIGSRSFSHLLNAIERYIGMLRNLASGGVSSAAGIGGNAEAKADILAAVANFWRRNRHMITIVFDKLMQYQIVDPSDVVSWTFANRVRFGEGFSASAGNLGAFEWDLLKGALDKANGRAAVAKRKVQALKKEEDDTRAKVKAGVADNSMEVDVDAREEDVPALDNPALTLALKAFTSLTREQKVGLSQALDGFVMCLAPASPGQGNPYTREVITEKAWHNRANWGNEQWEAWETWGWYRHFCRLYAPYMRNYIASLSTLSFGRFEDSTDIAGELLKKTFTTAVEL